jgi:hypothetical protein
MSEDNRTLPPEMSALVEADSNIFVQGVFLEFLKWEMERAVRYNFGLSLLLFQIIRQTPSAAQDLSAVLALALRRTVRSTDFLGTLASGVLGLIAPHADQRTPPGLLRRLESESVLAPFQEQEGTTLRFAYASFPFEASTLPAFLSTALTRLAAPSRSVNYSKCE